MIKFILVSIMAVNSMHTDYNRGSGLTGECNREKIGQLSSRFATNLKNGDVKSLVSMYGPKFHYLPQYRSAISDAESLQNFYGDWFASVDILSFERSIFEIDPMADRAVETGVFKMVYFDDDDQRKSYEGNYMVVWAESGDTYRIEAEGFVSDTYLPKDEMPYQNVKVREAVATNGPAGQGAIMKEIRDLNKEVVKNVKNGNGRGRAEGFHRNAIYMPNFNKRMTGMSEIQPYLLKTYTPDSNLFVNHTFYDIVQIDKEHVLVIGHFKGGWNRLDDQGLFEGNMLNLRKRNEEGKLVMFRQLVNSDR